MFSSPEIDALLGTAFADLIAQCGGYREGVERLIMGGPMMGFAMHMMRFR
jgi:electron transport complex protein RnfC